MATEDSDPLSLDLLQAVAGTFGLLSATTRVHIVYLLAQDEYDVGALAERLEQSVPAVSNHLAKLKLAGIVRSRREGKRQIYMVDDPHVVHIVQQAVSRHRQNSSTSPRTLRRSSGA